MAAIDDLETPGGGPPLADGLFDEDDDGQAVERFAQEWEVRKGRSALFWAGGLQIFGDSLLMGINGADSGQVGWVLGVDVAVLCLFCGFGLWARKRPVQALGTAIAVYLLLAVWRLGVIQVTAEYDVYFDPEQLQFNLAGLLIKGLVVFLLVKALLAAVKLQHMNRRDSFFKD